MDAAIWAALIAAVGSVLAAVVTRWTPSPTAQKRLIALSFVLAAVTLIAVGTWWVTRPGPAPQLTITDPSDQSLVEMSTRVSGSSANISREDRVMLVVYWVDGNRYYPAVEPIDFEVGGDWSIRASVGQEDDGGVVFDLIVVLNDAEAQAKLENYLDEVRASGGSSVGLRQLPEGSRRLDTVSVTRAT